LSVDDLLLLGRVAFVALLYLFLVILAILMRRELGATGVGETERAPADLLIVDPFDTGYDPSERIPLFGRSTVGRDDENTVIFNDTYVSGQHARLTWNGRGWVVEDLGSTNGTKVNGKPLRRARVVKPGDIIEFGRVKTKLVPV
jgi:pSer/pThr/pTyr-binding forkhead associated (FHA) protein